MNKKIFADAQIYLKYIILQIISTKRKSNIMKYEVEFSSNVYAYQEQ